MLRPDRFVHLAAFALSLLACRYGYTSDNDRNRASDSASGSTASTSVQNAAFARPSKEKWSDSIQSGTESSAFRERMRSTLDSIPENVQVALWRKGWRVRLTAFVVDAAPQLRGIQPRGWPQGATWDNTDAAHLPDERLLIVAERRRTMKGNTVFSTRSEGAFRHELGHAFDMASGRSGEFRSSGTDFIAALEKDRRNLTAEGRSSLLYYLQSDSSGRQEVFAEAFAIVLGGGSDVDRQAEFRESFPATLETVRQTILAFE